MSNVITLFDGDYRHLSNFYRSAIQFENSGLFVPTVEHAFQATKLLDKVERERVLSSPSPGAAKRLGRAGKRREDWDAIKDDVMLFYLRRKFAIPDLRRRLLATGDAILVEGNTWGDVYWGVCKGKGQNKLGLLLMQVRQEILDESHHCG